MEIPKLYVYIYRNVLNQANNRKVVDSTILFEAIRQVVMRAPVIILRGIILEMENLGMIKELPQMNHYRIIVNKKLKKKVRDLKPHVFNEKRNNSFPLKI